MMQPPIQKTSFKTVQSPRVKYISPKEVALLISGRKASDRKTILRTTSQKPSEQKTVDKSQWNSFNDVRCSQAHTPDKEQRTLYDEIAMDNLTGGSGYVSGNDYGNTGIQEENFTNCLASETCGRWFMLLTNQRIMGAAILVCPHQKWRRGRAQSTGLVLLMEACTSGLHAQSVRGFFLKLRRREWKKSRKNWMLSMRTELASERSDMF